MILMGIPIMNMDWQGTSNSAACLQLSIACVTYDSMLPLATAAKCTGFLHQAPVAQDLQKLAGNGMHMRAILAAIVIVLRSMDAKSMAEYLR